MLKIGITERGDAAVHFDEWRAKADTVDGVILITKNPEVLLKRAAELPEKCIIHCTITGWGGTAWEPQAPPLEPATYAYTQLLQRFGPERVVLRVDPILPTREGAWQALTVLSYARGRTRISFLDLYPHVRTRLRNAGLMTADIDIAYGNATHAEDKYRSNLVGFLEGVHLIGSEKTVDLEVCGEPGMDCVGCVSVRDLEALGLDSEKAGGCKGQRAACPCLACKVELLSNRGQCQHGCLYCYWK